MGAGQTYAGEVDEETLRCYRHAARETALRCIACERPICVDCSVAAPVGIKCRECARMPRTARARVPAARLVRTVPVAIVAAGIAGSLYQFLRFGIFGLLIAGLLGGGVGAATRWAAGGYRDPVVSRIAAVAAGLGILAPIGVLLAAGIAISPISLVWLILAAAIAAGAAHNRAS